MQEFRLQQGRHLANFVEQDRSPVAQFEFARFRVIGAGESALFVAEKLALEQVGGNRGAVDLEKCPMSALGKLVDESPQHFLAGAAFAQQQHGNIYICHQRGLGANLAHGGTGCNEEDIVGELFHFAAVSLFTLTEAEIDDGVQFRFLKRLGEIVLGAQFHGMDHFAGIIDAGQHDHFYAGLELPQLLESLQAIDAWHEHVEQYKVRFQAFFHQDQRFLAGGRGFDCVVVHFEQCFDIAKHAGFIVHQQDLGGLFHRFLPLLAAPTAGL